jgi:DNA integrity scanning protein DisA with diadenylate cyclase activity
MVTFEIKGLWGVLFVMLVFLLGLSLFVVLPVGFVWSAWNALMSEVLNIAPLISFWQAGILYAAMVVALLVFFQPRIALAVKKMNDGDDSFTPKG